LKQEQLLDGTLEKKITNHCFKQGCICLISLGLHTIWMWLCICEYEATITAALN